MASADEQLISRVKKDVSIWNINSFAEFYMQIFNKYQADYTQACHKFISERARFMKRLQTVSYMRVLPSQANYFCCEVLGKFTSHELAKKLLAQFNIMIKTATLKLSLRARTLSGYQ